jgi:hypothetical protein
VSGKIDVYKVGEQDAVKITADHEARVCVSQGAGVHFLWISADHEARVCVHQPGSAEPGTVKVTQWHGGYVQVEQDTVSRSHVREICGEAS